MNLVTKTPPDKTRFAFKAGGGYNDLVEDSLTTFAGMAGGRWADNKVGLIFTASYLNTDRGSDNFEPAYDDGSLEELQLRDYLINRERLGFTSAFDYRVSENATFFMRTEFSTNMKTRNSGELSIIKWQMERLNASSRIVMEAKSSLR